MQTTAPAVIAESLKKQRDIQDHQKKGQRQAVRCQLIQQHGGAGNAAVIQIHRCYKYRDPYRVDNACK